MGPQAPRDSTDTVEGLSPQEAALARAASAWAGRLARTLKTCRLYDRGNPTVARFREELAAALTELLQEHGALALRFSSTDVLWREVSLYPARSREDNLGLPFYRDGIRALTFVPGVEPREVDVLVDALLRVTNRTAGDADLVTLLWDAELAHVNVDYVSTDANVEELDSDEAGGEEGGSGGGRLMPWPGAGAAAGASGAGSGPAAGSAPGASGARSAAQPGAQPAATGEEPRSDDWTSSDIVGHAEVALGQLEEQAPVELARLRDEYETEGGAGLLAGALALVRECLDSGATDEDREQLGRFIARLLQEAMAAGAWSEARHAAQLLRACTGGEDLLAGLLADLCKPDSAITSDIVRDVDHQGVRGVQDFLAFAQELGPPAVDWLMHVIAESGQQRTRRMLTRTLAELCRQSPERLAPWLSDPRWYVVRNVVHTLGFVGGGAVAGLLKAVREHPEERVRREVVATLANVERWAARPVLLGMLEGAGTQIFCAVLHLLSSARDPEVAQILLRYLLAEGFGERPPEERRAICSALGSVGDDGVLPQLEAELHRSQWLSAGREAHRQAIARCVARIGTPAARGVLEQGARCRVAGVRSACEDALNGARSHD